MFDELKKSISAILYERTTSPLFGSLIVSWSVWNWRIIYVTLFISEEKIEGNKIDYIYSSLWNHNYLLWYPLVSTLILLTVIPFISNGAYWLSMLFEDWRLRKKREIEGNQQLTLEQSITIREEIYSQEKKFETLLESKELEIRQLKNMMSQKDMEIEKLNKDIGDNPGIGNITESLESAKNNEDQSLSELKGIILGSQNMMLQFEEVTKRIQAGWVLVNAVTTEFIALLESEECIKNVGEGIYEFTDRGRKLQSLILRNKFKRK